MRNLQAISKISEWIYQRRDAEAQRIKKRVFSMFSSPRLRVSAFRKLFLRLFLIKCGVFAAVFVCAVFAQAQKPTGWSKEVSIIKSEPNKTVTVNGDLESGKIIEDLSWAWSSSNACFPATQSLKYRGNHVLYATTLPPRSIMKIVVTPDDESANMSLYGYRLLDTDFSLVPDLPRSITCESNEKWDRPWKNKVQTHERKIEFQNPGGYTYNIVIGVAAPKGVTTGKYKVSVSLES